MRLGRGVSAVGEKNRGEKPAYLARSRHTQGCQQRVGALAAVGSEHPLDEAGHVGAVKDIELGGFLLKDLGEGEALDGAASVVGGVERDVAGGRLFGLGLFDGEEALAARGALGGWSQAQIDLEEVV